MKRSVAEKVARDLASRLGPEWGGVVWVNHHPGYIIQAIRGLVSGGHMVVVRSGSGEAFTCKTHVRVGGRITCIIAVSPDPVEAVRLVVSKARAKLRKQLDELEGVDQDLAGAVGEGLCPT